MTALSQDKIDQLAQQATAGNMTPEAAVMRAVQEGGGYQGQRVARKIARDTGRDYDELWATLPSRQDIDASYAEASAWLDKNVPRMASMPTELFTRRLKNLSPLARQMAARSLSRSLEKLPKQTQGQIKNHAKNARERFRQRVDTANAETRNFQNEQRSTHMQNTKRDEGTSYLNYSLMKGTLRRAARRGGRPLGHGADPAQACGLDVVTIDGRELVNEDEFYAAKRKLENGQR